MSGTKTDTNDPIVRFKEWLAEAMAKEPSDGDAVALATADARGRPNVRMVLAKGVDERGFMFFSNRESAKGQELAANPQAALCFHWKSLRRQVRVRGPVSPADDKESDAYFASRPKDSRIGAWASRQSRPIEGMFGFEKEIARFTAKYALGEVPRPEFWGGYRLTPLEIEFWMEKPFRLHERILFVRENAGAPWTTSKLFP